MCEVNVPAGWAVYWMLGDGAITPYNPDDPENLGRSCYDFTVATGETAAFEVDNTWPGGEPRTPGYWKNWNACTRGNQVATAEKNGGADEGFYLVEDLLPITIGEMDISTCEVAVDVLDRRDVASAGEVKDGKKMASDPAYKLAGNLLAAKLNLAADAETCLAIVEAVDLADEILAEIGFNGSGEYYKGKSSAWTYTKQEVNALAGIIDYYNNGYLCGP
jgi:hypothetical protein